MSRSENLSRIRLGLTGGLLLTGTVPLGGSGAVSGSDSEVGSVSVVAVGGAGSSWRSLLYRLKLFNTIFCTNAL